ncbi:hypothetical protein ABK040_014883 [Willaertia magna]
MKLHELPLEIQLEVMDYLSFQEITQQLLFLSKEYYNQLTSELFWKYLLKKYLLNEIKNCKDCLNNLISDKELLQNYFNFTESLNCKRHKQIKYLTRIKNSFYRKQSEGSIIILYLLQNFIYFYKRYYVVKKKDNNNLNFKHLLEQCVNSKWSTFFKNFDQCGGDCYKLIFKEIYCLQNENIFNNSKINKYYKKEDLQYIINYFLHIKNSLSLQNIIYKNFYKNFYYFINYIKKTILKEHGTQSQKLIINNIIKLYSMKKEITIYDFLFWENLLPNFPNLTEFFLQNINFNDLYLNEERHYFDVSNIILYLMDDSNNINDDYCKKLQQYMEIFITKDCDLKLLIKFLSDKFISLNLNKLLLEKKDTTNEIYNFLQSLQFFNEKFEKIYLSEEIFNYVIQYNFKNFIFLYKINVISKDSLFQLFHNKNFFNIFGNTNNYNNKINTYLDFFINELKFDVYSYNNKNENIIVNSFRSNIYPFTFITILQKYLQEEIDFAKIKFPNKYLNLSISKTILNTSMYEDNNSTKLNSIQLILNTNQVDHSSLYELIEDCRNTTLNEESLLALNYLFLNIKVKDSDINLKEYIKDMFEKKGINRKELEEQINERNIKIDYYKETLNLNSDIFIYFIYKSVKQMLRNERKHSYVGMPYCY